MSLHTPTAPLISIGARSARARVSLQVRWLLSGLVVAFATPFLFADLIEVPRDGYYAIYVGAVMTFVGMWARRTQAPFRPFLMRNWRWGIPLGIVAGVLLMFTVLREPSTPHPHGWSFAGALLWRGVVYGATDGMLLSVFPIIAVFSLFAAQPLRQRPKKARAGIGALALAVSLVFTAVYHLGYPDFRSSKASKPIAGDAIWSAPTLLTLSPLGAPIAHIGLHVSAVAHGYETDLFLPPHRGSPQLERPQNQRRQQAAALESVLRVLAAVSAEFTELTGRAYGALETYRRADTMLVAMGSSAGTVKEAVDELDDVGLLRIGSFRPFPAAGVRAALEDAARVIVLDRADSPGGAPPLYADVAAAMYGCRAELHSHVYGLGGRELHPVDVAEIAGGAAPTYVGLRGEPCPV